MVLNVQGISLKEGITLLAFLLMIKSAQSNSVLYEQPLYKMAAKVGIGDGRTFKKYLNHCLAAGLCTKEVQKVNRQGHRVVISFISYKKALALILEVNKYETRH